jgi:hypothetical protein
MVQVSGVRLPKAEPIFWQMKQETLRSTLLPRSGNKNKNLGCGLQAQPTLDAERGGRHEKNAHWNTGF